MPHKVGVFRSREKAPREAQFRGQEPTLEALMEEALASQQAGNVQEAEARYRRILERQPNHPGALHAVGAIAYQAGDPREALNYLSKAAKADPQNPDLQNDLGTVLMELGELDAAETCYRTALGLNPAYAEVHYNLGNLLCKQEKVEAAIESFRKAVAHKPDYAGAYYNLGLVLQETGRLQETAGAFTKATQLLPYWADAHKGRGDALDALSQGEAAVAAYRTAIRLNPSMAAAHFKLGKVLHEDRRMEEAIACYHEALRHDPQMVLAHINLGTALQELGQLEESVACYRAANRYEPTAEGYYGLASARRFSPDDKAEIAAMETHSARKDLPDAARIYIHFALGKVNDDCGQYDQAFDHYQRANQLMKSSLDFDRVEHTEWISRYIATFSEDFFSQNAGLGSESELPVFIIGMPRSGTTLVEQIISSHPAVHGAGEVPYFHGISEEMPALLHTSTPYPECVTELYGEIPHAMTEAYIAELRKGSESALRVTDKHPFNFHCLGLIVLLFPKARIIHCRRDPMDVCLSIYFQYFKAHHPFAYDLQDIAHYYRQYERLMAHWRRLWPGRMLEVDYEALVADQIAMSRKLIDHCGLDWDERCLAFYKTERVVHSASNWQVRQPIYKRSVERWKHYEKHLGELVDALAVSE